ncbi:MAG: mechanosensitive ion channel family protein [Bryobacteraceae bacterium]
MSGLAAVPHFLAYHWQQLIVPFGVLALTLALGYLAKRIVVRLLRPWVAASKTPTAQIVTDALKGPFMVWVLILGTHLAMQSSDLPSKTTMWIGRALLVLWILSLTSISARLVGDLIRWHGSGIPGALPVTTISQTLAQLAVVMLGLLVLLNLLGISITPILTALGVGGLAVALALQDTLSNLFAGFYIAVARQVRLGDYIRLNTGEEGYVTDIGWRSTTVKALANNMIIIPNSKLGQAIITNYYLPEKRVSVSIQVGVSSDSDPERVERVLLEEAQAAAREISGLVADPGPSVMLDPGFGDWSLNFTVGYTVEEFSDQFRVRHELRKRILKRLRNEKIDMPYPTRTVYLHGQGDAG